MEKSEFNRLFEKFVNDACTEEERKTVESWFDVLPESDDVLTDPIAAKTRVWNKISAKTKALKEKKVIRWPALLKVAAVLVAGFAIATYFLLPQAITDKREGAVGSIHTNEIGNAGTTSRMVKLDDGSEVKLEPDSRLRIISMTDNDKRVVSLEGTAFFSIAHNPKRPFYVHTKNLVTKVLGTSFTVIALPGQKEEVVQVKTGKVAIYANTKDMKMVHVVTITPNHQVRFDEAMGKLTKSLVEEPTVIKSELPNLAESALKSGSPFIMEFEEKPVSDILEALKKVYGVNIIYDKQKLSKCLLTTTLKDENLYTRLEVICKAIGVNYVVEGTTIEVMGANCQKEIN